MSRRIGLALSGGGAFGAYQVGVIKAYVEEIGRVDVLAGSSVGALNAVALASAPSLRDGVEWLERIWIEEAPGFLRLPLALASLGKLGELGLVALLRKRLGPDDIAQVVERGLLSQEDLRALVDKYVDVDAMALGPPVYVSVYESEGGIADLLRFVVAEAGFQDTPRSKFLCLQDLAREECIEAVLASTAIPLIFQPRTSRLADGGIGGRQRRQGSTPVDPLVTECCDIAFVSHLGDGSLWSRDDYPQLTLVEIRPRKTIGRGFWKDILELDRRVLAGWLRRGYEDARAELERVLNPLRSRDRLVRTENALAEEMSRLGRRNC